jgi:hypothetical protein
MKIEVVQHGNVNRHYFGVRLVAEQGDAHYRSTDYMPKDIEIRAYQHVRELVDAARSGDVSVIHLLTEIVDRPMTPEDALRWPVP